MHSTPYSVSPQPLMPPQAPTKADPGSPWALVVGVIALVMAALGLLLTTTAGAQICALVRVGDSADPEGDALAPGMFAVLGLVAFVALLVALAPVFAGFDRGRSAGAWVAGALLPWALCFVLYFAMVGFGDDFDEVVRGSALLGFYSASALVLALLIGTILLGIRPGRRWLAHRVLARTAPAELGPEAPGPLRKAPRRFLVSLVLSVLGTCGSIGFYPLSAMGDDPDLGVLLGVLGAVALLFVVVPLALACLGAVRAREGRRGGARLARVLSAGPLVFLLLLALMAAFAGVISLIAPDGQVEAAVLPPGPAVAIGIALALTSLTAAGFVLASLAALADPRSDHYLTARRRMAEV
ncbi:hypothetical protein [Streptomyces sp. NPDC058751]|uniref:hypothetical protein n=1 Tax=Streptomyces sp. NPDC058751 TaxID=3346623 RepID=UPI0036BD9CCB